MGTNEKRRGREGGSDGNVKRPDFLVLMKGTTHLVIASIGLSDGSVRRVDFLVLVMAMFGDTTFWDLLML